MSGRLCLLMGPKIHYQLENTHNLPTKLQLPLFFPGDKHCVSLCLCQAQCQERQAWWTWTGCIDCIGKSGKPASHPSIAGRLLLATWQEYRQKPPSRSDDHETQTIWTWGPPTARLAQNLRSTLRIFRTFRYAKQQSVALQSLVATGTLKGRVTASEAVDCSCACCLSLKKAIKEQKAHWWSVACHFFNFSTKITSRKLLQLYTIREKKLHHMMSSNGNPFGWAGASAWAISKKTCHSRAKQPSKKICLQTFRSTFREFRETSLYWFFLVTKDQAPANLPVQHLQLLTNLGTKYWNFVVGVGGSQPSRCPWCNDGIGIQGQHVHAIHHQRKELECLRVSRRWGLKSGRIRELQLFDGIQEIQVARNLWEFTFKEPTFLIVVIPCLRVFQTCLYHVVIFYFPWAAQPKSQRALYR